MFKFIMVGDSSVGKSSIRLRFTDHRFEPCNGAVYQTIGVDYGTKLIYLRHQKLQVHVWDTAGQRRFRSIQSVFFNDTDVILIVYDLTNRASFEAVKNYWIPYARDQRTLPHQKIVVIGNKSDNAQMRQVSTGEGKALALLEKCCFHEVSACTGNGVDAIFYDTVRGLLAGIRSDRSHETQGLVNHDHDHDMRNGCSCVFL
jgi:small GTP-binding protein